MASDINNNSLDYNEETNPLYHFLKKQATEFELFGQRLRTEIQNSYQEFTKLQEQQKQEESNQTNHETTTEFQRAQQIVNEIMNLSNSQTELIEALKSRVEELETESIIKNQDVKKLRQELELNKLRIKKSETKSKSDTKGKSVDIGDKQNPIDHEEIWNYEGLNWEDIMNENLNLLNISKTTHTEPSSSNHFSSSSQSNSHSKEKSENIFLINQIHTRVQKIINRRENYENFKSLKEKVRGHVNKVIEDNMNNPNFSMKSHNKPINTTFSRSLTPFTSQINSFSQENQEIPLIIENLHSQIQQIIKQKEVSQTRVRLKHFKALKSYTLNNFIQYTKTNMFNSLDILSQSMDEYITRGVIPELPYGYKNYTEYEKSDMFNRLNKVLKARVVKLTMLEKRIII
ncbi:unnamed protein product [Rhizophagus irregularis]|nr:unnamed protein product [Rhizophagus irregularis]